MVRREAKELLIRLYDSIHNKIESENNYMVLSADIAFVDNVNMLSNLSKKFRTRIPFGRRFFPSLMPKRLVTSKYSPIPVVNEFIEGEFSIDCLVGDISRLMSESREDFLSCLSRQGSSVQLYRQLSGIELVIKSELEYRGQGVKLLKLLMEIIHSMSMIVQPWQSRACIWWTLASIFLSYLLLLIPICMKFTYDAGILAYLITITGFLLVYLTLLVSGMQYVEVLLGLGKGIKSELDWMTAALMSLWAYVIFFVKDVINRNSLKIEVEDLSASDILNNYSSALAPYLIFGALMVYSFIIIINMKRNRDIASDWVKSTEV